MATINTANRDIRDIGIAFGVAIGFKIVWGLSLDLIDMAKGKKAASVKEKARVEDVCHKMAEIDANFNGLRSKEGDSPDDILAEGATIQKQAQKVTLKLVTATEEVSALADAIEEVVSEPLPDLKSLASAASVAVEELKILLEDTESTAQELAEAQDLCKKNLKDFQEGISLTEQRDGDIILTDEQYHYSNLLDLYRALLPKVKTARAAITRKGKGNVK